MEFIKFESSICFWRTLCFQTGVDVSMADKIISGLLKQGFTIHMNCSSGFFDRFDDDGKAIFNRAVNRDTKPFFQPF